MIGFLLVGASVATVIIGSWHANRPHEVRGEWVFFTLLAMHAVLCLLVLLALRTAWRTRREAGFRAIHALPLVLAIGYAVTALWFFGLIVLGFLVNLARSLSS